MTANEIKEALEPHQIITILQNLGVNDYKEDDKSIQFPTICHNALIEDASLKLYYYKENKLFHCYTECGESFDIFGLIKRVYECRGIDYTFQQIISLVSSYVTNTDSNFAMDIGAYQRIKLPNKRQEIELTPYPEEVLDCFEKWAYQGWVDEGISLSTIEKYHILYSISQDKIIIPHYDINGNLVGIRGRALNEEDILLGKYRPVTMEGITYAHQLSLNLYGLNFNKKAIDDTQTAILFEAEKSVMLMDSYFPLNNSVAVCGSSFNKNQLLLLLRHTKVKNIIIAFDKEYQIADSLQCSVYLDKIRKIGEKYNSYCNFYYVADKEGILDYKDSPIDKGKEIFEYLLSKKMQII